MSNEIFCSNCGSPLKLNDETCKCGYIMPENEKIELLKIIKNKNTIQLFNKNWETPIREVYNKISDYELDSTYYLSSSAKSDFKKKQKFIKNELVPKVTQWREKVIDVEKKIVKDKLEVYARIYQITDFIINDFFGRFKMPDSEHSIKIFQEIRDYSKYEIAETITTSDLDFSDVQNLDIGVIGSNILRSGFRALENGSFVELAQKSEWSKSDQKRVAAEVGISVGIEVVNNISNAITQNSDAIKNIRKSNEKLNKEMGKLVGVISGLSMEEKTLKKLKRLYDRCDLVLDFTYNCKLLPIVNKLIKNPIFIEYKNKRRPFDLEQEKIQINETVLKENINLSFWSVLLQGKKLNFRSSWKKRIKITGLEQKYKKINNALNETLYSNLNNLYKYQIDKTEKFKQFEKSERKVLQKENVWRDSATDVISYAKVFKHIRKQLN